MSRTMSSEALAFGDRLERTEGLVAKIAALEAKFAQMEEAAKEPKKTETFGSRLREMNAKTDAYLARFQEQVKEQQKTAETARRKAEEETLLEIRTATQSPSLDQIQNLVTSVATLIAADSYGSSETREQERMVWPRWCAVVDALLPLFAIPVRGWDVSTGKGVKALRSAVEDLGRAWGWSWSIVPDVHREREVQGRVRKWEERWNVVEKREALRWLTAFELGKADRPDSHVMRLAESARTAGMPTPNLPSFLDKQPAGTRMSEHVNWASLLWREVARNKKTDPALGNGPPHLNEDMRAILYHHVISLQASLPGPEPQRGYTLDGRVILPSNGSFVAPVVGGFLVHESQKAEVSP